MVSKTFSTLLMLAVACASVIARPTHELLDGRDDALLEDRNFTKLDDGDYALLYDRDNALLDDGDVRPPPKPMVRWKPWELWVGRNTNGVVRNCVMEPVGSGTRPGRPRTYMLYEDQCLTPKYEFQAWQMQARRIHFNNIMCDLYQFKEGGCAGPSDGGADLRRDWKCERAGGRVGLVTYQSAMLKCLPMPPTPPLRPPGGGSASRTNGNESLSA